MERYKGHLKNLANMYVTHNYLIADKLMNTTIIFKLDLQRALRNVCRKSLAMMYIMNTREVEVSVRRCMN